MAFSRLNHFHLVSSFFFSFLGIFSPWVVLVISSWCLSCHQDRRAARENLHHSPSLSFSVWSGLFRTFWSGLENLRRTPYLAAALVLFLVWSLFVLFIGRHRSLFLFVALTSWMLEHWSSRAGDNSFVWYQWMQTPNRPDANHLPRVLCYANSRSTW